MTCIVIIRTKDGLVFCSDKLRNVRIWVGTEYQRLPVNDATKLELINDSCVVALAGTVEIPGAEGRQKISEEISRILADMANNAHASSEAAERISKMLVDKFSNHKDLFSNDPTESPVSVVIAESENQLEAVLYEVVKLEDGTIKHRTTNILESFVKRPIVLGVSSSTLESANIELKPWNELSQAEAFEIAITIIEEAHKQNPSFVGETIDGLILLSGSVEWRFQGSSFETARAIISA